MVKLLKILILTYLLNGHVYTKQSEAETSFLSETFNGNVPKKQRLIVKGEAKGQIKSIMGSKYKKRLFSYWQNDTQQVWILNSIGKYKPITAAFSIQNCSVKSAHVLVYREQHGYEIKYPFFLTQFTDAKIDSALKLDSKIDNISAATLSVNSMKRMAKMALLLSKLSNENSCT